jgi:alpha-tubulin suppressor-like RCC1 family protein
MKEKQKQQSSSTGSLTVLADLRDGLLAVDSSVIGSHSMAIDDGGNLYGWGLAYAIGL